MDVQGLMHTWVLIKLAMTNLTGNHVQASKEKVCFRVNPSTGLRTIFRSVPDTETVADFHSCVSPSGITSTSSFNILLRNESLARHG